MKKFVKWFLISLLIALLFIGAICYLWYFGYINLAKKHYYRSFQVSIPTSYDCLGVDVSRYQGLINWQTLSTMKQENKSIDFVLIKSTEGKSHTDIFFKYNWKQAEKTGMIRGAYHYFLPEMDGQLQALHFLKTVNFKSGDLFPVVDIEVTHSASKTELNAELTKFANTVKSKLNCPIIIYSYVNFYTNHIDPVFDNFPFWAAHYTTLGEPQASRDWSFWQFTDKAKVSGIGTRVDLNVFKKSKEELKRYYTIK